MGVAQPSQISDLLLTKEYYNSSREQSELTGKSTPGSTETERSP